MVIVTAGQGPRDRQRRAVILRNAERSDESALQEFDLGEQHTVWLSEISEILSGLISWRDDEARADLDRRVIADMQHDEVRYVHWLVYPTNLASIAFSRSVFPEADETYPPEDSPYASFVLSL